jgi:probable biosynthetic protein (TIGR04098 family)
MYRSRSPWWLGMPHTQAGGLFEAALLAHAGDLRWRDLCAATGVPASEQRDADGYRVYASFYYVAVEEFPPAGLGAFGPDDRLEVVSTLTRWGRSMLDGEHALYREGTLPSALPALLPPAPRVRLSNVFVREGAGPDDLRVTTPVSGRLDDVPASATEPDSYRLVKEARQRGSFFEKPGDATPLWGPEPVRVSRPIDPDRDVNGVGLVYFANYVTFADAAERAALVEHGGFTPVALDARRTLRRRIGFYGNAQRHDVLHVDVAAWRLSSPDVRLLVDCQIRRGADDRLIAVTSVEKRLAS